MVGRKLAQRFGWKVGDHVPLKPPGYIGGGTWDFNVRAIYNGKQANADEGQFWLQHKYFYEKGPEYFGGRVGWYVVRVVSPDEALRVAKAIDAGVRQLPGETRTQTESAFAAVVRQADGQHRVPDPGDRVVVFFTLLLVTGNTMAIAVRERTGELAVLKAIGYSDRFVLGLVLAESLVIARSAAGSASGSPAASWRRTSPAGSCLMYLLGLGRR